jgi:hypothetical protein
LPCLIKFNRTASPERSNSKRSAADFTLDIYVPKRPRRGYPESVDFLCCNEFFDSVALLSLVIPQDDDGAVSIAQSLSLELAF